MLYAKRCHPWINTALSFGADVTIKDNKGQTAEKYIPANLKIKLKEKKEAKQGKHQHWSSFNESNRQTIYYAVAVEEIIKGHLQELPKRTQKKMITTNQKYDTLQKLMIIRAYFIHAVKASDTKGMMDKNKLYTLLLGAQKNDSQLYGLSDVITMLDTEFGAKQDSSLDDETINLYVKNMEKAAHLYVESLH